ncbi:hypothetical protein ACT3TB_18690 [Micrococcaceae sp. AOP34-BR2-30]
MHTPASWKHVPTNPSAVEPADDFSHLFYARGYILHEPGLKPRRPTFWRSTRFAGRVFRWDPRGGLAAYDDGEIGVLLFGHALHSELGTTDLRTIATHLLEQRRVGRTAYLDALEDMFGQFVVIDRAGDDVRFQTDAIGSRAAFHDTACRVIASHVRAVGRTLKAGDSKYVAWVGNTTNNDFPGRTTRFDGVWQLLPNSELQVNTGEIHRVGPRPYTPLTVEQAAEEMLPILHKQVEVLLASGREIIVSASAGIDTRTSLASFAHAGDAVQTFTYTKDPNTGHQSGELHRDKLAGEMASELGLPHRLFELTNAEHAPRDFIRNLKNLSTRRSNNTIAWTYYTQLPQNSLHIRGQINGVGKWHFARHLHFAEDLEIGARRMASLTKRAQKVDLDLADPFWDLGEEGFQEYIDTTQLRSVPAGYRMTDMFIWEHRVGNWNHPHIVESDVTFDTYQLYSSRRMIRLMLSVPEIDRVQLSLFREIVSRLEPRLLEYPINGRPWNPPHYDLPLAAYQRGTTRTVLELEKLKKENAELVTEVERLRRQFGSAE